MFVQTTTIGIGTIAGTSSANSWVVLYFANGTLLANLTTDSYGQFEIKVPIWQNEAMYAVGGPGSAGGPVQFSTDGWGNGFVLIPFATTSETQTTSTSTSETETTSVSFGGLPFSFR